MSEEGREGVEWYLRQVIFLYLFFKQIRRLFLVRFIRLQVTASFLRASENTHTVVYFVM